MSDPIVLTRDKVKREWSDFEPKLVAAILSGAGSAVIIAIVTPMAHKAGIELTPEVSAQIPLAVAGFIGWLTPSVGTTVTKRIEGNGTQSETHSGNPVTTVTASTPIQPSAPYVQKVAAAPAVNTGQDSVTQILAPEDHTDPSVQPTAVAPTAASAFMARLEAQRANINSQQVSTGEDGH